MRRTRFFPFLGVLLIGGSALVGPAGAQHAARPDGLSDVSLPCGVRAALAAIGDRSTPDRAHFILEISRRVHHTGVAPNIPRPDALPALIAHLDRCGAAGERMADETLPLPLTVSMWVNTVFGGRVSPQRLAAAILESRNASLLYVGLLSLDEATREWIGGQPHLIAGLAGVDVSRRGETAWLNGRRPVSKDLATRHAAAFTLIASGLRVASGRVQVPGGEQAEPIWEALIGRSPREPAEFVRALLAADERHLPYMFGTLAQLSPAQAHLALHLDAPDPATRIASARRLHAVYIRAAQKWRVGSRAFWRPTFDPALLAAALRDDDEGRPVMPGTRRFWTAVFDEGGEVRDDPRALAESDPVDFAWLCERVFEGDAFRHRGRYHQVLFASRILRTLNPDQAHAAVEAVRAAHRYPALVAALERAGVVDVTVIAAAARRAAQLSDIGDATDAVRASAQFQGLLTLLQRATLRNSITTGTFAGLVTTLAAVELDDDDAYRGGLVRWLDEHSAHNDEDFEAQPVERALLDLVAGPSTAAPVTPHPSPLPARPHPDAHKPRVEGPGGARERHTLAPEGGEDRVRGLARRAGERDTPVTARIVEWEGSRYRVDLAAAEAARLERLRGEQPRPYLSGARVLIGVADVLRDLNPPRGASLGEALARESRLFARVANAVGWTDGDNWSDDQHWLGADTRDRAREVAAALQRAGQRVDRAGAARLAPAILLLADSLLARGLTHLVYATALGRPERAGFSAEEAAAQHDFGTRLNGVRHPLGPWEHPVLSSGTRGQARVTGSLLGLDVALAPFSLVRMSSRLPPRKPTLNETDRRALIESVALVRELGDDDRDRIVHAIRKGRDMLAGAATPDQAVAIADQIGMTGARRSLLVWSVTRAPDRIPTFLSASELLWLGLGPVRIDARLHAWGAPAKARLGCLCLQLLDRRSLEPFTGRWGSGIFASAFPDLNLRLAELLAELRMPAALLGPILTSATLELVNNTASRDADDLRGLVEFVAALTLDALEQHLALLTTDGPLVPIGKVRETSASTGVR